MEFKCHICGEKILGHELFLVSMSQQEVDRPFVACSERCCKHADSVFWVVVNLKIPLTEILKRKL